MIKRLLSITFVVVVNIAIFAVLFAVVEVGFRLSDDRESPSGSTIQWLQFAPFMMFTNPHTSGGYQWTDAFHHQTIYAKIVNNELGFAMREEVDFSRLRPKAENERVVILSGGSAAWGVGATSNETNIAGRMQVILNENQNKYRYTVLNLSMGGWVSVQQFIALSLYGRNLQPDWLVTMDGTNDVAVACAHAQGAGHVMHYGLMEAYMKAYVFGQLHPDLYRGWLENLLVSHSSAYRRLTGKVPVDFDLLLDTRDTDVGRSVIRPTTWDDVERQLELYVQTEAEMVDLIPGAKVILSTQPLPFNFENMFGPVQDTQNAAERQGAAAELEARLGSKRAESAGKACGLDLWEDARDWFMPASALRLDALAKRFRSGGRDVQYVNAGILFPKLMIDRNPYFIDPVHLNDLGMDIVARHYSRMILASDLPGQFISPQLADKELPDEGPGTAAPDSDEIRVIEASYGLNCRDFKVAPPAGNRVRPGNASEVVANTCSHKKDMCLFSVDVVKIVDPAQGCGKDFLVKWRCGTVKEIHQAYLPGEANGKNISLSCPAR